jgi:hypothetical protein
VNGASVDVNSRSSAKARQSRAYLRKERHTTRGLEAHPAAVQEVLALSTYMGHATIQITLDTYGHLFPGAEAEAAGLLDAYFARNVGGATVAPTVAHPEQIAA